MFTELSPTSSSRTRPTPHTPQRTATVDLELQSALKFGLAVALGAAAVWLSMPAATAALLLTVAVVLAARALMVLGHDPSNPRAIRPREHANWDGALAALLALAALINATASAELGAVVTGVAAFTLGILRLRTRYVA